MTTFTKGDLCIVDAAATSSDLELVLGIRNGPTSVHQLVDQLVPAGLRDAGITGPPPSTVMKAVFGGCSLVVVTLLPASFGLDEDLRRGPMDVVEELFATLR